MSSGLLQCPSKWTVEMAGVEVQFKRQNTGPAYVWESRSVSY